MSNNTAPTLWIQNGRLDPGRLQYTQQLLSRSEQRKLINISSEKRRTEYLTSRYMLRRALSEQFDQPFSHWQPIERPDQPPELPSLADHWHLSLSHSQHCIALALSPCPVGIDVEHRRPRANLPQIAEMICSPLERQRLNSSEDPLYFYRIWCRKEAWYKQLSPTEQSGMSLTQLCTEQPNSKLKFYDVIKDEFQLCLAILSHQASPEIKTINMDSINMNI